MSAYTVIIAYSTIKLCSFSLEYVSSTIPLRQRLIIGRHRAARYKSRGLWRHELCGDGPVTNRRSLPASLAEPTRFNNEAKHDKIIKSAKPQAHVQLLNVFNNNALRSNKYNSTSLLNIIMHITGRISLFTALLTQWSLKFLLATAVPNGIKGFCRPPE